MKKSIIVGVNDLFTWCKDNNRLDLIDEWDYELNKEIYPENLGAGSGEKVFWKCKGHSYDMPVRNRTRLGCSCPYCSKPAKRVLQGFNDLNTLFPDVAKTWHPAMNGELTPSMVLAHSSLNVWWLCDKNHYWNTSVSNRTAGKNCPYCCNQKAWPGFNDLESQYPEVAKTWDYEKNKDITPKDVVYGGSTIKYWWKCELGHSWDATTKARIKSEVKKGPACPVCKNVKLLKGFNDLATVYPLIAKDWNYSKNNGLGPDDYLYGSNSKVEWKCHICGYEWAAQISNRVGKAKTGCPACAKGYKVSQREQIIFYYVSLYFPDAVGSKHFKWLGSKEIDVYIPSLKLAIEYDGVIWHRNKKDRDEEKGRVLADHGIELIRFREKGCPTVEDGSYQLEVETGRYSAEDLKLPIEELFDYINYKYNTSINARINPTEDELHIYSLNAARHYNNSVKVQRPDLAEEWNYEKNGGLLPEQIAVKSSKRVWWRCKVCEHEWLVSPGNRAKRGCPKCGHQRKPSEDKLVCNIPDILKIWNHDKNIESPNEVAIWMNKSYWWKCDICSHEWQNSIYNIAYGKNRCPECAKSKRGKHSSINRSKNGNNLAIKYPEIALDWDYENNEDRTPENTTPGSTMMFSWKCHVCNNTWRATVHQRIKGMSKCHRCANPDYYRMVEAYDIDGNKINEYENVFCIPFLENERDKYKIVSSCKQEIDLCKGYQWKFKDDIKEIGKYKLNRPKKGILQYTTNGDFVARYDSVLEASKKTGIIRSCIGETCSGKHRAANGFFFFYESRFNENILKDAMDRMNKPVKRGNMRTIINLDTNEVFTSAVEAAKSVNKSTTSILNCCRGKCETMAGYRWAFVENDNDKKH